MCLSTVYRISDSDKPELICKEIAAILSNDDTLTFTDIMGIPTTVRGRICKVDLMDNYVYIRDIKGPQE